MYVRMTVPNTRQQIQGPLNNEQIMLTIKFKHQSKKHSIIIIYTEYCQNNLEKFF